MNPDSFFSNLARFGSAPALIDRPSGRVIRYSELEAALPNVSEGIVATWAKTSIDHLLFLLAALRHGSLVAPISFRLPLGEATDRARRLGANAIWMDHRIQTFCTNPRTPARPGTLLHTSGSSGRPRVVLHDLAAHIASAEGSSVRLPLGPGCGWLLQLPLHHVSGFSIPVRCLLSGATVVFADFENGVDDSAVTHLSLVPTQLRRLLDSHTPSRRLRAVLVGGAPLHHALVERAIRAGVPLHITYGMTESASQICTTQRLQEASSPVHSGSPLPSSEVRISTIGEIQIRGPVVANKAIYSGSQLEDLVDSEGWFSTGDLGGFNAEGNLVIFGRRDRLIISGGENIQPEVVEALLLEAPGVRRAIVVGKPHSEFGERPIAFLAGNFEEARVRHLLASRLERFAIPEKFHVWPSEVPEDLAKPEFDYFKRLAGSI